MEGKGGELAHGVLNTGGDDKVLGTLLLEDKPHALDIVTGIPPVAKTGEVAQIELFLQTLGDACCCKGNLAGDEGFASALALVVEEDAGTAIHVVGFAVFLDYPVAIEFGNGIGTVGVEGGVFVLGNFFYLAVEFACGGLVDAACLLQSTGTDGLKDTQYACGVDVGCELGGIETDLNVALCCQVIDFVGPYLPHDLHDGHGVAEVGIVEVEVGATFEVSYALTVVNAGTADDAMDIVAFL